MKKVELMLWDWVYHDYQIDHPFHSEMVSEPSQVIGIPDEETIRLSNETIDAGGELDDYDISPIPLTDEILEKNGFDSETFLSSEWDKKVYFKEFPGCVVEPDDTGYTFGTTRYWSEVNEDGSPIDWGTMYESRIEGLHYVYELQHALRLCGLSELADYFKV